MPSYQIKQSSTECPLVFLLVQSSDHITALTGASPTVTLSKAGAAFGSPAGAVSEIANGWYKVAANATDSGTLGPLLLHATAASGDPTDMVYEVVAVDPQDAVRYGLTALPTASPTTPNGMVTNGSGIGQITVSSGQVTVGTPSLAAIATAIWQDATAGDFTVASSIGKSLYTTGNAPGAASGLALVGSNMGTVTTATNLTNLPAIPANWLTAAGIAAAALNGKGDWNTTTPPTTAAIATAIWQDATAGDFTVASSIGKSLYTTGNAPGAASGLALVGSNVGTATSVTGAVGSVTGNVGGNVVGSVASVTAAVTVSLTQSLNAARNISAVADTTLTLNDALHCAIAAVAGQETVVGTTYTIKTASTATVLRIFTLDSGSAPTSRT